MTASHQQCQPRQWTFRDRLTFKVTGHVSKRIFDDRMDGLDRKMALIERELADQRAVRYREIAERRGNDPTTST